MNTVGYRELEKKFLAPTPNALEEILAYYVDEMSVPATQILTATTIDEYWASPGLPQFVRLRHSRGETLAGEKRRLKEVTVKAKDKGHNVNRLEVNVNVLEVEPMRQVLNLVLGTKLGTIHKTNELVIFCSDDAVISVSTINDAETYVEVEAPNMQLVNKHVGALLQRFPLLPETRSLFEIYVERAGSHTSTKESVG